MCVDAEVNLIDLRDKLNICENCVFKNEHEIEYVPFEIVGNNPKVLFVGEGPGFDELKEGRPFIGKSGNILRKTLEGMLDSYAIANIIQCHPKKGSIRTPTREECNYCVAHLNKFIEDVKPEKIILLGKTAYQNILPEKEWKNKSVTKMTERRAIVLNDIDNYVSFHPSYIARSNGFRSPYYEAFKTRFEKILGLHVEKEQTFPKLQFSIHGTDDLITILKLIENQKSIGFDYETNGALLFSDDLNVLGFAIAIPLGRAWYINIDRPLNEFEKNYLIDFLKRKAPFAYNAKYEMNASWSWLGEKILFNDTFVLCKMNCTPVSLKKNSRDILKVDFWEENIHGITGTFEEIFKFIKKVYDNEKLYDKIPKIKKKNKKDDEITNLDLVKALHDGDVSGFIKYVDEHEDYMKGPVAKLYNLTSSMINTIGTNNTSYGMTQYPYQWGTIPTDILGEYCCYDAYYTIILKQKLWPKYKDQYQYYITQTWLASDLEAMGINWNDNIATSLRDYYSEESCNSLIDLIQLSNIDDEKKLDATLDLDDESYDDKLLRLKQIFNPLSNLKTAQQPFWDAYRTPYTEHIVIMKLLEEFLAQFDNSERIIPKILSKNDIGEVVKDLREYNWNDYQQYKVDKFISDDLIKLVDTKFVGFSAGIISFHFKAHTKYGTLNIEDKSTWGNEFKLLFHLKRFKKILKSKNTYIDGIVGRNSVWLSKVNENIKKPPKRLLSYENATKNGIPELKDDEAWIMNTGFFENGATTKRWTSRLNNWSI